MLTERTFHGVLVWAVFAMAVLTCAALLRLSAPYGRHYSGFGWGPEISNRVGWVVMEMPATVIFAAIYFMGRQASEPVPLVLLGIWQCHYLNRAFVYPLAHANRGQEGANGSRGQRDLAFNVVNSYLNARFISEFGEYGTEWLGDLRFVGGLAFFAAGFALNRPLRQHPAGPSQAGTNRILHPGRWGIPLRLLPQLSGRVIGMVRVGVGDMVAGRTRVLHLQRG